MVLVLAIFAHQVIAQRRCGTWFEETWSGRAMGVWNPMKVLAPLRGATLSSGPWCPHHKVGCG